MPDQRQAGSSPRWWPGFAAGLSFKAQNPSFPHSFGPHEKPPLSHRLPAPCIRHLLAQFRADQLSATAAQAELQLSKTRFYQRYSAYLRAAAQGQADRWTPGSSGGDHHCDWPPAGITQLTTLLSSKPPSSYSACASERRRRLHFKTDRASVRRWAKEQQLAPDTRYKKPPQPVKRWQARALGARWQSAATPHACLPGSTAKQGLLDLLDDATRYNPGARLYERETRLAQLDFLARAVRAQGLPLALYVDFHSCCYTPTPDAFTQLGAALHFYGVALRFAPTPQAKGKIERRHDYWQKRRPPLLAADKILALEGANHLLDLLLPHANTHEIQRELGTPPQAAWNQAGRENRSARRPAPACPWWPFIWSQRPPVRVGDDGKVPVGAQLHSVAAPPRATVIRWLRLDGDIYYLRHAPDPTAQPLGLLHCPVC